MNKSDTTTSTIKDNAKFAFEIVELIAFALEKEIIPPKLSWNHYN